MEWCMFKKWWGPPNSFFFFLSFLLFLTLKGETTYIRVKIDKPYLRSRSRSMSPINRRGRGSPRYSPACRSYTPSPRRRSRSRSYSRSRSSSSWVWSTQAWDFNCNNWTFVRIKKTRNGNPQTAYVAIVAAHGLDEVYFFLSHYRNRVIFLYCTFIHSELQWTTFICTDLYNQSCGMLNWIFDLKFKQTAH